MSIEELQTKLYAFMEEKNYLIVEPKDITLFFNRKYGGDIKFSKERRLRNKKGFLGKIKMFFYRLNNLVHMRKGSF
jgi:hypothetical protein